MTPEQLKRLFLVTASLMSYDALRLKPREKQFGLTLSAESFLKGEAWGTIGISFPVRGKKQTGRWGERFSDWKTTEVWEMLSAWRQARWLAVDDAEGRFRLAPDQWPGWADAFRLWQAEPGGQFLLLLTTENDLRKEISKFSQSAAIPPAAENAEFSHTGKYGDKKPHTRSENAEFSHSRQDLLACLAPPAPGPGTKQDYKVASLSTGTLGPSTPAAEEVLPPCRLALKALSVEQQRIFDALQSVGAFGPREEARGNWFVFVLNRCAVAERLLGELRYRLQRADLPALRNPGAWMNNEWQRWGRPDT